MATAADEWQLLGQAFSTLGRQLDKTKSINVNASATRKKAIAVAQQYFRSCRPLLQGIGIDDELSVLDQGFENLIQLASGANAASSYKKNVKSIRKVIPRVTARIELSQNVTGGAGSYNAEDDRIITTLEGLVPSAGLSYQQAIADLSDDSRVSFRGPALELREALRETLDHLAPDNEVMAATGYVQEKERHGPTMKQKVRFILKARGQSKSSSTVPEQTALTIDEMIGTLTRSIYDRSSVATHVASDRKTVAQIRRYVAAILHDILEL